MKGQEAKVWGAAYPYTRVQNGQGRQPLLDWGRVVVLAGTVGSQKPPSQPHLLACGSPIHSRRPHSTASVLLPLHSWAVPQP